MLYPGILTDIAGFVCLTVVWGYQLISRRRNKTTLAA